MRQVFIASICREGVLGGGITADDEALTFRTGKVTVSPALRHLVLKYSDMRGFTRKQALCFPVFSIEMNDGEIYKFIIFNPKRFSALLRAKVKPSS